MRISLGENSKMALDTLRDNKVRSFLTVLGVVIGITALITVSSILVGFYEDVTAYLSDYGPNTIWIFKVAPGVGTGRMPAFGQMLSPEQIKAIVDYERSL